MNNTAEATSHAPDMEPSSTSIAPTTAPHVDDESVVDVEVVQPPPGPVAAVHEVPAPVPSPTDPLGGMGPAQYRKFADRLLLDQRAWAMFYDRCQVISAAGMYGHKRPETVAAAALKGMSMGMSFMESLSRIKVIHGQPVIRGSAAINHIHERSPRSKCRCITGEIGTNADVGITDFDIEVLSERMRARYSEYWTEDELGLDKKRISVWVMSRPGWAPKVFIYTWERAVTAGLPEKNQNYKKHPERCLKWQAASEGAQEMFGDILDGLYFEVELASDRDRGAQTGGSTAPSRYTETPIAPEPEPEVDSDDHPKVIEFKELLEAAAAKVAQPGTDEFNAAKRKIYNDSVAAAIGRGLNNRPPTLPQLDKLIAHLKELD